MRKCCKLIVCGIDSIRVCYDSTIYGTDLKQQVAGGPRELFVARCLTATYYCYAKF